MGAIIKQAVTGNAAFWLLTIFALVLITLGIIFPWPPDGTIDGSVLTAVGELLGFGALWAILRAIDKGVDAEVSHKDTTIKINNPDGTDTEKGV